MIEETQVQYEQLSRQQADYYDLVIIGTGPAGMSAALCAGRADLKVLLIDRALPGGEAATAYKIDNYLGFPEGILGDDLTKRMEAHLDGYNVQFTCEAVEEILNIQEEVKIIKTDLGATYKTKSIIIAAGLEPKKLNMDFENKFLGRGISYYAQSDVETYRGQQVAVVGGGNCACYAADYLSQFVDSLYLIHRSDSIKAVKRLKEKVLHNPKISAIWNSEITEVFGIDRVEKIKVQNVSVDQHTWIDIKAVFVYVGRIPPSELISMEIDLDENGFIVTDEFMRTNIKGIYAAGDVRSKQIRQIATAVSDGMIAAINVEKDLFR
jgi:thioredoxin reductase (NADPH)